MIFFLNFCIFFATVFSNLNFRKWSIAKVGCLKRLKAQRYWVLAPSLMRRIYLNFDLGLIDRYIILSSGINR